MNTQPSGCACVMPAFGIAPTYTATGNKTGDLPTPVTFASSRTDIYVTPTLNLMVRMVFASSVHFVVLHVVHQ